MLCMAKTATTMKAPRMRNVRNVVNRLTVPLDAFVRKMRFIEM